MLIEQREFLWYLMESFFVVENLSIEYTHYVYISSRNTPPPSNHSRKTAVSLTPLPCISKKKKDKKGKSHDIPLCYFTPLITALETVCGTILPHRILERSFYLLINPKQKIKISLGIAHELKFCAAVSVEVWDADKLLNTQRCREMTRKI